MRVTIRNTLRQLALLLVALALAGGALPGGFGAAAWAKAAAAADAAPVVDGFHATLLAAARKAGPTNYQARYDALDPAVRHAFDLTAISRSVLGAYWDKLSAEQQHTFTERFARNTIATYAGRFDSYSGETFTFVDEQKAPQGDVRVVESDLTTGDGERHRFSYLLRRTAAGWRITNILVDNVSQIAVQRSQFTSIMRDHGFDQLLTRLDTLTSSMREAS